MAFAEQNFDFPYWQKQQSPLFADLYWNIPEQKTSTVAVVGGNMQGFHGVMKIAENLSENYPIRDVKIVLPSILLNKLPPLGNIEFVPSTDSGSLAKSTELNTTLENADFAIIAGDLSRNSETVGALEEAIKECSKPILLARDAVDALAPSAESILTHEKLFIIGSMAQIQKIFRTVYYPKMLMLSQPIISVLETLHKFTLTYKTTIITFHQEQIIVANNGKISTTPINKASFTPISLWNGELANRIAVLNLFNPNGEFEATTAAILAP